MLKLKSKAKQLCVAVFDYSHKPKDKSDFMTAKQV